MTFIEIAATRPLIWKSQKCLFSLLTIFEQKFSISQDLNMAITLIVILFLWIISQVTGSKHYVSLEDKALEVIKGYQTQHQQNCLVLAYQIPTSLNIIQLFQVVHMNNWTYLESWMREDRHEPKFGTGCTVILTEPKNLERTVERKFKNLLWIVTARLPKKPNLNVEHPVIELLPNTMLAHCPFAKGPKISYYKE